MAVEITLAEKVYAALAEDHGYGECADAYTTVGAFPETDGGYLTDFELDLRGWGLAVGLACGIARGEDAYEPERSVCKRALTAARDPGLAFIGHQPRSGAQIPPDQRLIVPNPPSRESA